MFRYRTTPTAVTFIAYLTLLAVPVVLVLSVVGSSPYLLAKVVPEDHRSAVASFGIDVPGLSEWGASSYPVAADTSPGRYSMVGSGPMRRGTWTPRRLSDYPPPAGLAPGLDFAAETSDDGVIAHWPCDHEIPVWSFDAPPGSEADLAWSVEMLAFYSGIALRYAGPGSEKDRESDGAISVTYGDHPMFQTSNVAGVGGATVWENGRITQGSVTLRPDSVVPVPGHPWTRSLTLHELMHSMGVDHAAAHGPEVMASAPGPYPQPILGHGDQFALHLVGCR